MSDRRQMKWQRDFETYFDLYNTFVFEGLVDDMHIYDDGNGNIEYCTIGQYFDKIYSNHQDPAKKKRVIVYDPTESEEKRFHIYDDNYGLELRTDEETGEEKVIYSYDSMKSQHFWDIANDSDLRKLLIDHRSSGASLDISKIHYAITEGGGRIHDIEIIEKFAGIFEAIKNGIFGNDDPEGYLFVIKMTSRLVARDGAGDNINDEELMIFRQLLSIAQSMHGGNEVVKKNKLVILINKTQDVPKWFASETENPYLKMIKIEKPSERDKLSFLDEMVEAGCFGQDFVNKYNEQKDPDGKRRGDIQKKFLGYTSDFGMLSLLNYKNYLLEEPLNDHSKIGYSINNFVLGHVDNPWDDDQNIIEMLKIKEKVSEKLIGQDNALQAAQDIIARAALGVDRAENPNAPRVVLFLAGPTGTGKTELCKQLAEIIFGSEDRIVRFDMSEYGQEESDQKLFGAPPGYVGYEEGGKLTNAIKKEPFSLVLFDEIEKAHRSILDKFLQILGDGRLTDGHGETVRFTDCIIVITSNAGVVSLADRNLTQEEIDKKMNGDVKPEGEMDMNAVVALENQMIEQRRLDKNGNIAKDALDEIYERVKEHLRYNVKSYFNCFLGRPELYGRVEDSMVYYNYIGRGAVKPIAKSKMKAVVKTVKEELDAQDVTFDEAVLDGIAKFCQDTKVRSLGARGVIKSTGKLFSTSLSRELMGYYDGTKGTRADLAGKVIHAYCEGDINSADDIKWSIT